METVVDIEDETSADRFRRAFVETSAKLAFTRRQLAYIQSDSGIAAILGELDELVNPAVLKRAIASALEDHRLVMIAEGSQS